MAITATFKADFANFYDAVQKAEVSLKDMEAGAGKVQSSLDRMVKSFSGQQVIGQANLMVKAIGDVENVSKLTEAEQRRVNAALTEAIAKYQALGKTAPADMQRLADATKQTASAIQQAENHTSSFAGGLSKINSLLGAFGIGLSVGAVVNFGRQILANADAIVKMADQTRFTTTEVQRLQYISGQTGSNVESLVRASQNLTLALGDDEGGAAWAMQKLHINMDAFQKLRAYDQMTRLGDAIRGVKDPTEQAEIAAQLFGKTWKEILPAIKSGMKEMGDQAPVMADQTIRALDEIGDAWTRLGQKANVVGGSLFMGLSDQLSRLMNPGGLSNKEIAALTGATRGLKEALADLPKPAIAVGESLKGIKLSSAELETAERNITERGKELDEQFKKNQASAAAYAKAVQTLRDQFSGVALQADVRKLAQAFVGLTDAQRDDWAVSLRVGKAADDLRGQGAQLSPVLADLAERYRVLHAAMTNQIPLIRQSSAAWRDEAVAAMGLGDQLPLLHDKTRLVEQATASLAVWFGGGASLPAHFALLSKGTKELTLDFGDMSQALSQLAQIAGGSFGSIAQGLATIVGAADAADKSIDRLKLGMEGFKSGQILAGIANLATGIFGITSAAISAGRAIYGLFDRDKGRDAVEEFAKSFGGFDPLHKELLALGDAGEALWVKLTQGVGRNNPQQAARVISEVEDALMKQKFAQEAATVETEEGAKATIETASEAAKALDDLNGRLKTNEDAWGEWSADVTGFIDRLSASIRAMPLPSPAGVSVSTGRSSIVVGEPEPGSRVPSFDIGTRGQYLDFGSGTLAMLHGRERVMREGEGGGVVNVNISAIDSRSVEDWLRRGGAEQIMRALPRAWVGAGL